PDLQYFSRFGIPHRMYGPLLVRGCVWLPHSPLVVWFPHPPQMGHRRPCPWTCTQYAAHGQPMGPCQLLMGRPPRWWAAHGPLAMDGLGPARGLLMG
ncbi:unnamed protein product, partial [Ectocarpus fasciculatus]